MSIYKNNGDELLTAYDVEGQLIPSAYNAEGQQVFPAYLPMPSGDLNASSTVPLPDIYNNGHSFSCTGLAYDRSTNTFLIGDIGKELPSSPGFASQIVRVTADFTTAIESIPLHTIFAAMSDVQGITIDTSDGTIWFCSTEEKKIRHIDSQGNSLGQITFNTKPTGIAYSPSDDSLWVLMYGSTNNILHVTKSGTILGQYTFAYQATLDQCFLDVTRGYLYITAGDNYSGRNNIYRFDISTHTQQIACTVDSYSVEGLWIGSDRMVILNDGYYHSAVVPVNQANIYTL